MGNVHLVVLAGGSGTRFWPISRMNKPKQFLSILDNGESLIQSTVRRSKDLSYDGKAWIVTNNLQKSLTLEHIPEAKIICEPAPKNTAAAIGFAALHIKISDPDGVMIVLSADHAVKDEEKLRSVLRKGIEYAQKEDVLVTVGVQPTYPNTGYGYIKTGELLSGDVYTISRFFEKPSLERAKTYFESGDYLWNSGMFIWKVSAILKSIEKYMPDLYEGLLKIEKFLKEDDINGIEEVFKSIEPISIDFGVLEHARNCVVVRSENFGWNDVGSWDAWAEHFEKDAEGNLLEGEAILLKSTNNIVHSQKKLTALLGVDNLIVIDSEDALLVCSREYVQDVKDVVKELNKRGKKQLI